MRAVRSKKPGGGGSSSHSEQPHRQGGAPYANSGQWRGEASSGTKLDPIGGSELQLPASLLAPEYDEVDSSVERDSVSTSQKLKSIIEREHELEAAIADYDQAVEGLNRDRAVLQEEVQRVLQLERQREDELARAMAALTCQEDNELLMEEVQQLRDSIAAGCQEPSQAVLIKQLQRQITLLQNERDKAQVENDNLYAEVQELQKSCDSRAVGDAPASGQQGPWIDELRHDLFELGQDLEHGYKILESFKDELDQQSEGTRRELDALRRERLLLANEVAEVKDEATGDRTANLSVQEVEHLRDQLEQALSSREKSVRALEEKLKEKDAQLQRSLDMRRRLEQEVEDLRKLCPTPLSLATEETETDSTANTTMEMTRLRQQMDEVLDSLEDERTHCADAKAAAKAAKDDAMEARNREQELLRNLGDARSREEELQTKVAGLAKEIEVLHSYRDTEAEEVSQLKRQVQEERGNAGAQEETIHQLNKHVNSLEARLQEMEGTIGEERQAFTGAEGRRRTLEAELYSANQKIAELEKAAVSQSESTSAQKKHEDREREMEQEIDRLLEQRENCEARCTVLAKELQASDAELIKLRRQLKGSGMLTEEEAADLKRQTAEAQEEIKLLRDRSIFVEEEALDEVHRELSTLRQAVLDARHKYKGLMEEEADARQNLARQMRRALADLREEKRLLTEEVGSIQREITRRPTTSVNSVDGDFTPVPSTSPNTTGPDHLRRTAAGRRASPQLLVKTDLPTDDRLRDLELRNRQLQFEGRLLESREGQKDPERKRLIQEAQEVNAESYWRLQETLSTQEELLLRAANLMSLSGGSPVDRLDTDQEGRIYRQLKGRIEDLEDRLRSKIDGSKAEERDLPIARCLQDLLEAQRDVSAALGKLLQSQSQLQERQAKAEEKQELQEMRSSIESLFARQHAQSRPSPQGRLQAAPPRRVATPVDLNATFAEWSPDLSSTVPQPSLTALAYMDLAQTPAESRELTVPSPYSQLSPPSHFIGSGVLPHQIATPGGILLTNLHKYAPPSWRAARGLPPTSAPHTTPKTIAYSQKGRRFHTDSARNIAPRSANNRGSDEGIGSEASDLSQAETVKDYTLDAEIAALETAYRGA